MTLLDFSKLSDVKVSLEDAKVYSFEPGVYEAKVTNFYAYTTQSNAVQVVAEFDVTKGTDTIKVKHIYTVMSRDGKPLTGYGIKPVTQLLACTLGKQYADFTLLGSKISGVASKEKPFSKEVEATKFNALVGKDLLVGLGLKTTIIKDNDGERSFKSNYLVTVFNSAKQTANEVVNSLPATKYNDLVLQASNWTEEEVQNRAVNVQSFVQSTDTKYEL